MRPILASIGKCQSPFTSFQIFQIEILAHLDVEKLRDVLQAREVASLNYFEVFLNYINQFSWSILVISVYFGLLLSWRFSAYLFVSWCILSFLELSPTISGYFGQSYEMTAVWPLLHLNFYFLCDNLKQYTKVSNFCRKLFLIWWLV